MGLFFILTFSFNECKTLKSFLQLKETNKQNWGESESFSYATNGGNYLVENAVMMKNNYRD